MELRAYRDMDHVAPEMLNVRYHLLLSDHTTLYRKFSRLHGVDVRQKPEYNVDDWLNPSSPNFQPAIHNAIFHYSARSTALERFEVCISTSDMEAAAWKYAHHSQLVLDGTFGICSSRLLLFIALARDEDGKGVPVAFFLFSAPTGNQATHAGYNTEILYRLLNEWREHLNRSKPKTLFQPCVAITDTDTKERGALLQVWPDIILLLCKFHLRQCWTNHRKTTLKGRDGDFWKDHVQIHLQRLESECVIFFELPEMTINSHDIRLISMSNLETSIKLITEYEHLFKRLVPNPASSAAASGGLNHLQYLRKNWMHEDIWKCWSEYGRIAAASCLNISVDGVIPTTNHLESFNAILKRKHLAAVLRSGHRLRFDSLIHLLITRVLPGIFKHRKAQREYHEWLSLRFRASSGNRDILTIHRNHCEALKNTISSSAPCGAWWPTEPDSQRDAAATLILQTQLLKCFQPERNAVTGVCMSSTFAGYRPTSAKPAKIAYDLVCLRSGEAGCSCPDFENRWVACKHLRAMKLVIESFVAAGTLELFSFPQTRPEAERCYTGRVLGGKLLACPQVPSVYTGIPNSTNQSNLEADASPPVSMLPPVINWDPVLVQALGGDCTTLGDPDSGSETNDNDLDSDGSIGDEQKNLMVGILNNLRSVTLNVFPKDPHQSCTRAIQAQIEAKVIHDVNRLLPPLYGLANTLTDLEDVSKIVGLDEFLSVFATIQKWIQGPPITPTQIRAAEIQHKPEPVISIEHSTKRKERPQLLPPSPECRQKRKDSHAPL